MATDQALDLPTIALLGPDGSFLESVAAALGTGRTVAARVVPEAIEQAGRRAEIDGAAVVVVDLDARRRESLVALQGLMGRLAGRAPVIVLTEAFDDAVARWFLQIRVADFLRKPVEPRDVLRACVRALKATAAGPEDGAEILSFLPAAGGVGTTTLAIETAMLLGRAAPRGGGARGEATTCLVDLDFQSGACADYLDLEPRLDLDEVGPHPERLDSQLLEVMLSRHGSGLSVLAAPGKPCGRPNLDPAVVTRLLDLVSQRFENVVIDLPRACFPWTDQVLLGSDRVFVVTDMTVPSLRLARRLADALAEQHPGLKPRVICNRFEQQMLFGTGLRRADVERALDGFLAGTVPNNYKLVREAIDRGATLDAVKAGSNVSTDLKKIVFAQAADA